MIFNIDAALSIIESCQGRVILLGMGKSGIICAKIAATMSSTGTSAHFIHPGEAFHGDLGMIRHNDVVILISKSGETDELLKLIPYFLSRDIKIISFTGNKNSTLAKYSNVVLDVGVEEEACNNNLAPTSSTTCALVMGDAIAALLSSRKNFQAEDFAQFHPGGSLGRRLLNTVGEGYDCKFGWRSYCLRQKKYLGLITDGDIHRTFDRYDDCRSLTASEIMTSNPFIVNKNLKITEEELIMREKKINHLLVTDINSDVVGLFTLKMIDI